MICVVGIVFSMILMLLVWNRFLKTPTVTTIDTTTHPIWGLAFPAVTICNFNKVYKPEAEEVAAKLLTLGLNRTDIDNFLISLPKLIRPEFISVNVESITRMSEKMGYSTEELMLLLMQPCEKLLMNCTWLGEAYNCSQIFKTIKSIEGYCCAFNYHSTMPIDNTDTGDNLQVVPQTAAGPKTTTTERSAWMPGVEEIQMVPGAGRDVGLTVLINLEAEKYVSAIRPYIGASVMIHSPNDYPEISLQTSLVTPGSEASVALAGTMVESVENVRSLDLQRRKCWFHDEVKLRTTSAYSYQTCVTECRMEHIRRLCNCIPFYYPVLYQNVRICNLADVKCLRTYRQVLSSLQTPIDAENENKSISQAECACLPQCSDSWYTLTTESAVLKNFQTDEPLIADLDLRNLSIVNVYFRDITCLKYRKDTLMTWDGLFASFGGIFGLCLGGSVISLVELVYYFTINIFHSRKKVKSRTSETPANKETSKRSILKNNLVGSTNDRLKNLNVLRDRMYLHVNNVAWGEVKMFPKQNQHFEGSTDQ